MSAEGSVTRAREEAGDDTSDTTVELEIANEREGC